MRSLPRTLEAQSWDSQEPERDDPELAQDEYERAAAECDERAPWPGDPARPFKTQRERVKVGGAG